MRKTVTTLFALLLGLALVGAGCSSNGSGSDTAGGPAGTSGTTARPGAGSTPGTTGGTVTGALTVSAAASLTEPFKKIGDDFTAANPGITDVTFSFDSSSTLAKQLVDGAPADAFASADQANMTKVVDPGLVSGSPTVFARNRLAIVVKPGNPKAVTGLADLARVGTVALCGADVPCGKYADQILQQAGVTLPNGQVTRGQNAKATLAAVAEGDADAAIVYVTDATSKVDTLTIPDAQNVIASYPVAVMRDAPNPAAAQAFVDYLLGEQAQATLRAAGFLPPA